MSKDKKIEKKGFYTLITETESGEKKETYLNKPSAKAKQAVFNLSRKDPDNFLAIGELLFRECWAGGYDIMEDEDTKFSGCIAIVEMIDMDFKPAELKKN